MREAFTCTWDALFFATVGMGFLSYSALTYFVIVEDCDGPGLNPKEWSIIKSSFGILNILIMVLTYMCSIRNEKIFKYIRKIRIILQICIFVITIFLIIWNIVGTAEVMPYNTGTHYTNCSEYMYVAAYMMIVIMWIFYIVTGIFFGWRGLTLGLSTWDASITRERNLEKLAQKTEQGIHGVNDDNSYSSSS